MTALDKHVDVQISKETATVSRTGFGTPLVMTYHTRWSDPFKLYGSLIEMTTDGFTTDDAAYKLASSIFAQSPRPSQVMVGRRATAVIREVNLTPRVARDNFDYSVTVDGETFTHDSGASATIASIVTGLVTLINAGTKDVLATDNTTDFDIETAASPGGLATAGPAYQVEFDDGLFEFVDNTVTANVATDLVNLAISTQDWYGLCLDLYDAVNIAAAAVAIEAYVGPKIYAAESQDTDIITSGTSDIASTLQTAAYDRTFLMYSPSVNASKAAGWLGKQLPTTPGSATWKFKTLNGVSADEFTVGEVAFADGKSCNTYQPVGGINITQEGVMASGEFIDVTRFIDWLQARTKEDVFQALARNPKIPFTDAGIQAIVGAVEGVLGQGVANGGINPDEDITVTAPRASEVSTTNKGSRVLPDINFLATLAGAIHKTIIRGTVTV